MLKILATADLHIGRRPSKLPEAEDAERFSCTKIWEATVRWAIEHQVDLVVLAGDVVEHANRFFEATGPLERELRRLAEHGIPTYAVAGNHDFDVLPRIAEEVGPEYFHLLGRDGRWEEALFERDGECLRLHGWSFPTNHVETSPLAGYDLPTGGDVPILGLLHADLDVAGSRFAPVTTSELAARHVSLWVLGHVHGSRLVENDSGPDVLYPGSPQAMDPGEPGPHGPWLIEVAGPRDVRPSLVPLAKVRYDGVDVDLTGAAEQADLEGRVTAAVRRKLDETAADPGELELLLLRLKLTGRTPFCGQVDGLLKSRLDELALSRGRVTTRVEKVTNDTRPAIDLETLAAGRDPAGVLARVLLELESGKPGDQVKTLVDEAHRRLVDVHQAPAYAQLDDPSPDREAARQSVRRQGMLLLEALYAQRAERVREQPA